MGRLPAPDSDTEEVLTAHAGLGYEWQVTDRFFIRPEARVRRFFELSAIRTSARDEHLTRRRIDHVLPLRRLRISPLAADVVPEHLCHGRRVLSVVGPAGGHAAVPPVSSAEVYQRRNCRRHRTAVPWMGTASVARKGSKPGDRGLVGAVCEPRSSGSRLAAMQTLVLAERRCAWPPGRAAWFARAAASGPSRAPATSRSSGR